LKHKKTETDIHTVTQGSQPKNAVGKLSQIKSDRIVLSIIYQSRKTQWRILFTFRQGHGSHKSI